MKPVTLVASVFGVIDMVNGEEGVLVIETEKKNQYEIPVDHDTAVAFKNSRGLKFNIVLVEAE